MQMNDTTIVGCFDLFQMSVCKHIDECDVKHDDILSSVVISDPQ